MASQPLSTVTPSSPDLEAALRRALGGEVVFDAYTRHLFSTDASMYAIEPVGVAFPRDRDDVQAALEIAGRFGAAVLPRGAGTSLAGQTVGRALVLDFSRHMTGIVAIDPETRTARVQPGVVQDDLNRSAARHGLLFAPDTSTSNRATLGGMIGNNSCGARSARYGMTIDHVEALDVVLSDGSAARFDEIGPDEAARRAGPDGDPAEGAETLERRLYRVLPGLIRENADVIREALPPHWRRSGGYRLERLFSESGSLNLSRLVVGSEGTLAVTTEATVRLVEKPKAIAALVGHFTTIDEAIEAAPVAMDAGATTVELVDRMILDLARESPLHRHLPTLLEGEPGAILWVEFYGAGEAEAAAAADRLRARWTSGRHGYAVLSAPTPSRQEGFRQLRKAGLGLLMSAGRAGERSLAFVEDTAVAPERLAEYTRHFASILRGHGLRAGFYGHASAGCLHVRPFMDLSVPGAPERMRAVAEEVLALVREFGGMNASEHGDGLARGEFNPRFFGPDFYELMRRVKRTFDPHGRLNPGKKVDVPPMTDHLRDVALPPAAPLRTWFAYGDPRGSEPAEPSSAATGVAMRQEADKCARVGACRKSAAAGGVMCPSYMATRQEEHATRGRANALVAALSSADPKAELAGDRLHEILDLCLECKACKNECPLHVDMATLKSEALAHRWERTGVPLRARVFGHVRTLNRLGTAFAPLSNVGGSWAPARWLLERLSGIDARRPLPRFQRESLPRWYSRRARPADAAAPKGTVLFLADSFTSYTEPEIGRAAVELLELAGWEVRLVHDVCCGRSLISKGMLPQARERHRALLARLGPLVGEGTPVVGVEPSCVLTLAEEVPALALGSGTAAEADAARAVARATRLADDLLADAVEDGSLALDPEAGVSGRPILFHGHCHQKAGGALSGSVRILRALAGAGLTVLDAGCCGMAGSFGFEREHYDLSMAIGGQRLFPAVSETPDRTLIAATGVSCRQQIAHGTGRAAQHPIVLLREAVKQP